MPKIQHGSDAPDSILPHLLQIAERLWNDRAVVMVGAGFSKNASAAYPNWAQLGDVLYEKAYGKKPEQADKTYLSLLKVAEEAESVIGRTALDAVLQQQIPNDNVDPSELHERLLRLPWVDVLTTNYDTLLERAQRKVVNRRYTPVLDQHDLPYAEKPRIIKLHGSFPGHRPFVVTEEDYRQYPEQRAPFVNTVRQALLENTLCLIGFSGDDPNFLQWVGWIRDQMGTKHTQPIYLITSGSFPVSQQLLLAKRQIVVVDLAEFIGVSAGDHAAALGKFFDFVVKQDPYRLDWPVENEHLMPKGFKLDLEDLANVVPHWQSQRLLYPGWLVLPHSKRSQLLTFTRSWIDKELSSNITNANDGIDIRFLYELVWRMERCLLPIEYDGCVRIKTVLCKYWPFPNSHHTNSDVTFYDVENNHHLDWNCIREAWLALALSLLRFYREAYLTVEWMELKSTLCGLNKYLTDNQREYLYYQEYLFHLFRLEISKARSVLSDWRPGTSKPYWQNIRFAAAAELGQLDNLVLEDTTIALKDGFQKALSDTRELAQLKKISEFYQADSFEAYQMVFVRWLSSALSNDEDDVATSNEVSQMRLKFFSEWRYKDKNALKININPSSGNKSFEGSETSIFLTAEDDWEDLELKKGGTRKQEWLALLRDIRNENSKIKAKSLNKRWDELKAVGCDPWTEIKFFELTLTKPIEKQTQGVTVQPTFDLGKVNRSVSFGGDDMDALNAYAFLRFCEDIGLPFLVSNTVMAKNSTMAALPRILKYSPGWARASLFRLGETKAIDSLFDREAVRQLTVDQCDQLILHYLKVLSDSSDGLNAGYRETHTFEERLAKLLPEVISRLCCKCSDSAKEHVLRFVENAYSSGVKSRYAGIKNLVVRLFNSMSDNEKTHQIPAILQILRPADVGIREEREFQPPISLISFLVKPQNACDVVAGCQLQIANLLQDMTYGNDAAKKWAVATLLPLAQWDMLTEEQTQQFTSAYWQGKDTPESLQNDVYYQFVFLMYLPHNTAQVALFKRFINQKTLSIPLNGASSVVNSRDGFTMIQEISGAAQITDFWRAQDVRLILKLILDWWRNDKQLWQKSRDNQNSKPDFFDRTDSLQSGLQLIIKLVSVVIGPGLGVRTSAKNKKELTLLLIEMKNEGLDTLEAQVACLHLLDLSPDALLDQIAQAVQSNDRTAEIDALKAILLIAKKRDVVLWPQASELLAQFIQWSRSEQLSWALWVVIGLLQDKPVLLLPTLKHATTRRLQQLIDETDYQTGSLAIDFNHKIELRKIATMLASELSSSGLETDQQTSDIIEKWRVMSCSTDEFAEVRNTWTGA